MNNKIKLSSCFWVAMMLSSLCANAAKQDFQQEQDQPNIIFILTDDQGYGDIGRHGHPYLDTPHMDSLHDASVRFDNFYVSPSCSPTRAALMTGMHEFRNGVTHTLIPREHLYQDVTILPQLLQSAGYTTGFIGKWHLGNSKGYIPADRGFDWCSTNVGGPRKHFDVEMIRNKKRFPTKGFREDVFFDEAMALARHSCKGVLEHAPRRSRNILPHHNQDRPRWDECRSRHEHRHETFQIYTELRRSGRESPV